MRMPAERATGGGRSLAAFLLSNGDGKPAPQEAPLTVAGDAAPSAPYHRLAAPLPTKAGLCKASQPPGVDGALGGVYSSAALDDDNRSAGRSTTGFDEGTSSGTVGRTTERVLAMSRQTSRESSLGLCASSPGRAPAPENGSAGAEWTPPAGTPDASHGTIDIGRYSSEGPVWDARAASPAELLSMAYSSRRRLFDGSANGSVCSENGADGRMDEDQQRFLKELDAATDRQAVMGQQGASLDRDHTGNGDTAADARGGTPIDDILAMCLGSSYGVVGWSEAADSEHAAAPTTAATGTAAPPCKSRPRSVSPPNLASVLTPVDAELVQLMQRVQQRIGRLPAEHCQRIGEALAFLAAQQQHHPQAWRRICEQSDEVAQYEEAAEDLVLRVLFENGGSPRRVER